MKTLKNAGTHQILSIMGSQFAHGPLTLIELAGRTAYQSQNRITEDSCQKFVKRLIENGHESVLEHSAMTVQFDNVSRGFSHELVRHRFLSVTQQSTRYVSEDNFNVVVPPHKNDFEIVKNEFVSMDLPTWLKTCESFYRSLREKRWAAEDARQFLPIGISCSIVATANFREWRHILKLRTEKKSHWEIRRVMIGLLRDIQKRVPVVFDDIREEYSEEEARKWGME
jgi:thymidylate synthase (FAD)